MSAPHVGFVLVAYAVTAIVLIGLTLVLFIDARRQTQQTARLDDGTGRRRRRAAKPAETSK